MTISHDNIISGLANESARRTYVVKNDLISERKNQHKSVKDMAQALGVKKKYIRKFETYSYDPTLSELMMYALVLNRTINLHLETFK